MRSKIFVATVAMIALTGVAAQEATAQMNGADKAFSLEFRGTAALPTFDIADAADLGYGGGFGIGYQVSDKIRLMADVDLAMHGTPTDDVEINTYHYMAKIGYDAFVSDKVVFTVNLGAGAVSFGGDLPTTETYFAINAGAKLGIKLTDSVQFLISPQGDIAFSDEAVLGTDNSWVWPLGLGFRIQP